MSKMLMIALTLSVLSGCKSTPEDISIDLQNSFCEYSNIEYLDLTYEVSLRCSSGVRISMPKSVSIYSSYDNYLDVSQVLCQSTDDYISSFKVLRDGTEEDYVVSCKSGGVSLIEAGIYRNRLGSQLDVIRGARSQCVLEDEFRLETLNLNGSIEFKCGKDTYSF